MLRKWLSRREPVADTAVAALAVPDGCRVYAVGDIHGRDDLLAALLDAITHDDAARSPAETRLIFLGDYIDRGPGSAAVMARLIALQAERPGSTFLMGNHEEVMTLAAGGDVRGALLFDRIGGRETLISYGVDPAAYDAAPPEGVSALILAHVPPAHLAWLETLGESVRIGDYLFVHAGIRPEVALEAQSGADLRWIRGEFLDFEGDHGVCVVHGHSITPEVAQRGNRIGIDTGAFSTGRLTAIGLEGTESWFLQT